MHSGMNDRELVELKQKSQEIIKKEHDNESKLTSEALKKLDSEHNSVAKSVHSKAR